MSIGFVRFYLSDARLGVRCKRNRPVQSPLNQYHSPFTMKTILSLLIFPALIVSIHAGGAGFSIWTNKDGRQASMRLIEVIQNEDGLSGHFAIENGGDAIIMASDLSEADAKRLAAGVGVQSRNAPASVFDKMLDGKLVTLRGNRFARHEFENKPTKFYVFYYTASWCGPCRQYTPTLVNFYNETRGLTDHYEIILLTSDRNVDAMLEYARNSKMPWPHVDFRHVNSIKGELGHGVRGIPSVIVTDLEGNVVSRDRSINALRRTLLN